MYEVCLLHAIKPIAIAIVVNDKCCDFDERVISQKSFVPVNMSF